MADWRLVCRNAGSTSIGPSLRYGGRFLKPKHAEHVSQMSCRSGSTHLLQINGQLLSAQIHTFFAKQGGYTQRPGAVVNFHHGTKFGQTALAPIERQHQTLRETASEVDLAVSSDSMRPVFSDTSCQAWHPPV